MPLQIEAEGGFRSYIHSLLQLWEGHSKNYLVIRKKSI